MGPFYELVCAESDQNIDQALLKELKDKNTKKLITMNADILDAEQNLGESYFRF